ncbi:MAG: hypothetical protein HF312_15425 [Ignavibacteria bacterium]|jgi:hypothetical protein|nr:hypothetical protein [Ignavibacteria bacterium]
MYDSTTREIVKTIEYIAGKEAPAKIGSVSFSYPKHENPNTAGLFFLDISELDDADNPSSNADILG